MLARIAIILCATLIPIADLHAADRDAPLLSGWRGNLTGLFPDCTAPVEWSMVSTGVTEGLKCAASAPADGNPKDAVPVEQGLLKKWLAIGPFNVKDGSADFAKELLPGEATIAPRAGDKAGDLQWKPVEADCAECVTFLHVNTTGAKGKTNEGALATTCLYAAKAGKLRAVVETPVQIKVFANGQEVHSNTKYGMAVGSAYGLSNNRADCLWPTAPSFEFAVKQGWNRLVVKLMSTPRAGWNDLIFMLRVGDAAPVSYRQKNILWAVPLPDHSHGAPIVVGQRVFVTSEPDELLCFDKNTGKPLWSATNTYYDATPQAERDANPAFAKVEKLARRLNEEKDAVKRWAARKALYDALQEIDKKKYTMKFDGHLKGHFEIVGFCNTPASDGKHVYFWNGAGVAACYDLNGKRRWIRRLDAPRLFYSAAPAVIGGKLAVYFTDMFGLDAQTGQVAWEQPGVDKTVASLLPARLAGCDVFISQQGEVVRAADGKMLWKNPYKITNDTGWAPPTVIGNVMYLPWFGVSRLFVFDFAACAGDAWKPKEEVIDSIGQGFPPLLPVDMVGIPRNQTAGSPLIYQGRAYINDFCGGFYVVDLKTKKTVVCKNLNFKADANYVAMPVAASCTLVGRHVMVMDNQGHTVVLEPDGPCKEVARNWIGAQIPRDWAVTTQEYTTYAPPVCDGERIYIRGERHLYCIAKTGP
jgi:outer membrane protein assembly factor BamB